MLLLKSVFTLVAAIHVVSSLRKKRSIQCDHSRLVAADISACVNHQLGFTDYLQHRLNLHHRKRRVAIKDPNKMWVKQDDGFVHVPFKINTNDIKVINAFTEATKVFHQQSCIKFIPKNDSHVDFISLISVYGCYSLVGRQGGRQNVSLQSHTVCTKYGVAIHELLHALGFCHEMKRSDRDDYVIINYDNIWENRKDQFKKLSSVNTTTYGTKYDTQSIMHYGNYAASIDTNKMTVMSRANPQEILGQRERMSAADLLELNTRYQCDKFLEKI